MKFREFADRLEVMQRENDALNKRRLNMDTFGHWMRSSSRYLTYAFYRVGINGVQVLLAHFLFDLVALWFMYREQYLIALACWLFAHFLDNCDGDLARIRGQAHPKWGMLDLLFHVIANVLFWLLLAWMTGQWEIIACILGMRVIVQWFRGHVGVQWGEKNRWWWLATAPNNVNYTYVMYVIAALTGFVWLFTLLYFAYYIIASFGQSVWYTINLIRRKK